MNLIIHADDLGASHGITDTILRCVDEGVVCSTSVLTNGAAFDYAIASCHARPKVSIACHFNLVEGRPVAPAREVKLLTDSDGNFCHDFLTLWTKHRFGSASDKRRLEGQVRTEVAAQLSKLRGSVGDDIGIALDSHRHVHLIPFILDAVIEVVRDHPVTRVRLIHEPIALALGGSRASPGGLVKNALLNGLSRRGQRLLDRAGVAYPKHFLGVLFSGRMSLAVVAAALDRIPKPSGSELVEVLFHPGRASAGEQHLWSRYPGLREYYFSQARNLESETLLSTEFKDLVQHWRD